MSGSKDELRAIEDALIQSMMDASPEETLGDLREQGIDSDRLGQFAQGSVVSTLP